MVHKKAKEVAPDVQYEFDMLEWAYKKLSSDALNTTNKRNAYGECFLIHARNLIDFFVPPCRRRDDDVFASHFFDEPEKWEEHESDLCQYARKERDDINKTLAHLTYRRISEKNWNEERISNGLETAKSKFLGLLAPEQRRWFK